MNAPSLVHERRRAELATAFQLAGLTYPAHLQWWLRPDVSQAAPERRILGLGDAKSTELPGNPSTLARLVGYASASRSWWDAGWDIHMSLAVDPASAADWVEELGRAWRLGGLTAAHQSAWMIDAGLGIVSVATAPAVSISSAGERALDGQPAS